MNMIESPAVKGAIIPSWTGKNSSPTLFQTNELPSRSRLYGLVPCKVDSIWTASLTSYINRLGWAHRVSPAELVAQELIPHVSMSSGHPSYQPTAFCRH